MVNLPYKQVVSQADIGRCDSCGSDVEPRRRTLVDRTINGVEVRFPGRWRAYEVDNNTTRFGKGREFT